MSTFIPEWEIIQVSHRSWILKLLLECLYPHFIPVWPAAKRLWKPDQFGAPRTSTSWTTKLNCSLWTTVKRQQSFSPRDLSIRHHIQFSVISPISVSPKVVWGSARNKDHLRCASHNTKTTNRCHYKWSHVMHNKIPGRYTSNCE